MNRPVEIRCNSMNDLLTFTAPKIFLYPFCRFSVALTRIARAASRKHIPDNRAWAILRCDRNEVIESDLCLRNNSRWFTTVRAAAVPIVHAILPFLFCEGVCQLAFARCSSALLNNVNGRVSFPPIFLSHPILVPAKSFCAANLLPMLVMPFSFLRQTLTAMCTVIISAGLQFLFARGGVRMITQTVLKSAARLTFSAQAVFAQLVSKEMIRGCWVDCSTMGTTLNRGIHSVSLSLYHMMSSADGVICRRSVREATPYLADMHIVPQNGAES
jgi:hypothetical protein